MEAGRGNVLGTPNSSGIRANRLASLWRGFLDHVIVLSPAHLRRVPGNYLGYHHWSRTHLGLDQDAPERRSVQGAEAGKIVAFPQAGGLHHRNERRAA